MAIHQLPAINNPEIFESVICDLFNEIETKNTYKKFEEMVINKKELTFFLL